MKRARGWDPRCIACVSAKLCKTTESQPHFLADFFPFAGECVVG